MEFAIVVSLEGMVEDIEDAKEWPIYFGPYKTSEGPAKSLKNLGWEESGNVYVPSPFHLGRRIQAVIIPWSGRKTIHQKIKNPRLLHSLG